MGISQESKMVLFFFSGCKVNVNIGVFIDPPGKQRKGWPGWGRHNTNEHIKFLFHLCKYISTLTTLDHYPHSALLIYSSAAYLRHLLCTVCLISHLPTVQTSFSFFSIAKSFPACTLAISYLSAPAFLPNLPLPPTTA